MEKLIELLNEYAYGEHKELYYRDGEMVEINSERVISKKFWFIQWLVENEKIDLMKLKKWIEDNKFYCAKWGKITNMLLMLLSIQDNPIEFLISILK